MVCMIFVYLLRWLVVLPIVALAQSTEGPTATLPTPTPTTAQTAVAPPSSTIASTSVPSAPSSTSTSPPVSSNPNALSQSVIVSTSLNPYCATAECSSNAGIPTATLPGGAQPFPMPACYAACVAEFCSSTDQACICNGIQKGLFDDCASQSSGCGSADLSQGDQDVIAFCNSQVKPSPAVVDLPFPPPSCFNSCISTYCSSTDSACICLGPNAGAIAACVAGQCAGSDQAASMDDLLYYCNAVNPEYMPYCPPDSKRKRTNDLHARQGVNATQICLSDYFNTTNTTTVPTNGSVPAVAFNQSVVFTYVPSSNVTATATSTGNASAPSGKSSGAELLRVGSWASVRFMFLGLGLSVIIMIMTAI